MKRNLRPGTHFFYKPWKFVSPYITKMTNFRNFIQRKKLKKNHVDISYFVQCISACLLISLQSWIGSSVLEFISVPRASLFNSQQSFLCNPCHNRKRHNTKQFFCSFMRSPLSELSIHYSSIWCTRSSSFKTIVNYNLRAQNYCERTSFFFHWKKHANFYSLLYFIFR